MRFLTSAESSTITMSSTTDELLKQLAKEKNWDVRFVSALDTILQENMVFLVSDIIENWDYLQSFGCKPGMVLAIKRFLQSKLSSQMAMLNLRDPFLPSPLDGGSSSSNVHFKHEILASDLQIGEVIGSGGFGKVYGARWNGTDVALKVVHHNRSLSEESVEKLMKEAEMALNLKHPNIVEVYGVCQHPVGIVMERLQGSVTNALLEGKKTLSERISWAVQAARGMKYLHSRVPAVVHADIKSMNFLLNGAGVVKITDFGLALSRTDTSMRQQSRQADEASGGYTLAWCAPEVLQMSKPNRESDVYSFGVFLWEILTCSKPYDGEC